MSHLIKYPETVLMLPLQYFGTVDYYALMAACGTVIINDTARYDKRAKSTHRFTIADTHGLLQLTVPVAKPLRGNTQVGYGSENHYLTWHDICVSDHAQWWQDVDVSLASAYGRTPFYEFYIDRLRPCFSRRTADGSVTVADLDLLADRLVREILGIDARVIPASEAGVDLLSGAQSPSSLPAPETVEYYQVRAGRQGFHPNLTILDLIFNLGPEAAIVLREMMKGQRTSD